MSDDLAEEPILKALEDAIDGMEDMILYVDEYFRDKWGHQGYIDRAKAFREHYLSTLSALAPVTAITREALAANGFVVDAEDDDVVWMESGQVEVRLEGKEVRVYLDKLPCHPQPTTMEDLTRLSRPKPQ